MDSRNNPEIGTRLGGEAVEHVLRQADNFCGAEADYLARTNEPQILGLRAHLACLEARRRDLKDRLHGLPPPGEFRARRRRSRYFWAITLFLTAAGFFFALLAFDPYQLGWKAYLYCAGIAIVTPFAVDAVLERWTSPRLVKGLALLAGVAALTSLVLLALVRGDVFAAHLQSTNPAIVVDDASASSSPAPTDFYANTLGRLRLLMALLALAMELAAGLALHDARRYGFETSEDPDLIRQAVAETETQMVRAVSEIRARENEPAAFAAGFRRDFARALLTGATQALTKYLPVVVLLTLAASGQALAAERCALVVAIDLSQSVAARDASAETEFTKNSAAVGRLLARIPAGCAITVLGITDRSFAQPSVLLTARVDANPGYFEERLFAARQALVRAWTARQASLAPRATQTDLLGALLVAAERLHQLPDAKPTLVIFSDMRHDTAALTLETRRLLPTPVRLAAVKRQRLLADLGGVEVSVLGADAAGRTVGEWQAVRDFWVAYFREAGAVLKNYAVLRDLPVSIVASATPVK